MQRINTSFTAKQSGLGDCILMPRFLGHKWLNEGCARPGSTFQPECPERMQRWFCDKSRHCESLVRSMHGNRTRVNEAEPVEEGIDVTVATFRDGYTGWDPSLGELSKFLDTTVNIVWRRLEYFADHAES
eukprot:704769-Amphidinium_carterae.1